MNWSVKCWINCISQKMTGNQMTNGSIFSDIATQWLFIYFHLLKMFECYCYSVTQLLLIYFHLLKMFKCYCYFITHQHFICVVFVNTKAIIWICNAQHIKALTPNTKAKILNKIFRTSVFQRRICKGMFEIKFILSKLKWLNLLVNCDNK